MNAVSFRSFLSLTVLLPESFLFLFFLDLTSLSFFLVSVRIQRKQLDNTAGPLLTLTIVYLSFFCVAS